MTCADVPAFAGAYLDGELELSKALELEAHIETCDACAALLERHESLRATIRRAAPYYAAPPDFADRLRAARGQVALPVAQPAGRTRVSPTLLPWLLAAAATIVAVLSAGTLFMRGRAVNDPLQQAIVTAHIRANTSGHLMDVASTDRHTVKPWLSAKLDFSAPVPDLADDGFPLTGGRLDYIDRQTAALVYMRRAHVIDVFVWPDPGGDLAAAASRDEHGYNLVHFRQQGLAYWVISDLAAGELGQFTTLLAGASR
jgi:anti-sigma factor RsiW